MLTEGCGALVTTCFQVRGPGLFTGALIGRCYGRERGQWEERWEEGKSRWAAAFHIHRFTYTLSVCVCVCVHPPLPLSLSKGPCQPPKSGLIPRGEDHRLYQRALGGFPLPHLKYLPETFLSLSLSLKCHHETHSDLWIDVTLWE